MIMSQLLLVSVDLNRIRRSATFRVQEGNYQISCPDDKEISFCLIFGNGDRLVVREGESIPITEDSTFYMDLPEVNKKITATLVRL